VRLLILTGMFALAILLALGSSAAGAAVGTGGERGLTLDEAIRMALQKNEGLVIERESLAAARAAVSGAKGAYDPVLGLDGALGKTSEPVNSSLSGTSPSQIGPELKSGEAGLSLRQLLPTGGALSLRPGCCVSSVAITGPPPAGGAVGTGNPYSGDLLRAGRSSSLMSRVDIVVLGDVLIGGERANSVGHVVFL